VKTRWRTDWLLIWAGCARWETCAEMNRFTRLDSQRTSPSQVWTSTRRFSWVSRIEWKTTPFHCKGLSQLPRHTQEATLDLRWAHLWCIQVSRSSCRIDAVWRCSRQMNLSSTPTLSISSRGTRPGTPPSTALTMVSCHWERLRSDRLTLSLAKRTSWNLSLWATNETGRTSEKSSQLSSTATS